MVKGGVPPLPGLTVFGLWSWGSRPRLFDVSLLRSLAGAGAWGINRSAGQEKPRVSSSSALWWFSIAAAAGEILDAGLDWFLGIGSVWHTGLVKFVAWGFLGERRWRGQEKPRISKPRFALRVFGGPGPTSC